MSLIDTAETAVAPYLIWIKVGLAVIAVAVLVGGGFYGGLRWDQGTIAKMELADQQAANRAQTLAAASIKRQDAVVLTAAVSEAKAQNQIAKKATTLTQEITNVVPITVACIPVGLIRLLDAAAAGANTPDASFAPGQPDDACAPVSWRSVAADLADDYASGNANSEQLNALEAEIRKDDAAVSP